MRLLHSAGRSRAMFDDESLVSFAGLVPVMRLAEQVGLYELLADRAARCEGVRTPALRLLEAPPELTPREREIAQLAAHGHSSKKIAAQLVISVRTVDNALHGVYSKLGITCRADLAPILGEPAAHPSNIET